MKIINPSTGREEPTSSWVRIGREYVVIGILVTPGRRVDVQILTDDGSPGYWSSQMFETTSSRIPSNWAVQISAAGITDLTVEAWLRPGFWEDFFDSVPDAVAVYERELAVMMAEDPTPEWAVVNSAKRPASERLAVLWHTNDGTEERPGISVYGVSALHGWSGDEFPIRLWPQGSEAKYFRLFGEGWEVAMWDVALPDWPQGLAWTEALRGTLEFLINGGCRVAWLGDGITFCDPPELFSADCMSGGVLAALTSGGEFICPVDPDKPLTRLSDERMAWLRHYARGLADVD